MIACTYTTYTHTHTHTQLVVGFTQEEQTALVVVMVGVVALNQDWLVALSLVPQDQLAAVDKVLLQVDRKVA